MWFSSTYILKSWGDVLSHLFRPSNVTQHLWNDLAVLLKDKCVYFGSLTFSEICTCFSVDENIETDRVLDLSVSLAVLHTQILTTKVHTYYGGFFLTCEDLGIIFDNSFPA